LDQELNRAGIVPRGERSRPAGSIDRHSPQELSQLACSSRVEPTISAVGKSCDGTEDVLDIAIMTFLKHEDGHAKTSELAGFMSERIRILLHGVPDED
jgi:hypothetical protein